MDILKKSMLTRDVTFVILFCAALFPFCWCVEEFQREFFLAPRNFNPHPYEHHLAKIQDPGPVLFPTNEDQQDPAGAVNNRYNIITADAERAKHPIDNNPYYKVAEKIQYLINSRKYSSPKENQIDNEIFEALAQQGAKVLGYPAQEVKDYGGSSLPRKKNYAFAYKVLDKATGDDFSHQQIRNAKATNGEYRVKLPDGRLQIVSYKADKNGYKADVKYELDPEATQQHVIPTAHVYVPPKVKVNKVPVRQLAIPRGSVKAVNSYDFVADEGEQQLVSPITDPNVVVLEQVGPTQIPVNYVDIGASQTPSPAYLIDGSAGHESQPQYYPNIQLYTSNPREHLQSSYISTTAATPTYEKQVIRYTSTPVPPTVQAHIVHNADHGLFNPNLASTYAPPIRPPPGHKNVINTVVPSNNPNDAYRQTLEQENNLPEGIYIVGKAGKR